MKKNVTIKIFWGARIAKLSLLIPALLLSISYRRVICVVMGSCSLKKNVIMETRLVAATAYRSPAMNVLEVWAVPQSAQIPQFAETQSLRRESSAITATKWAVPPTANLIQATLAQQF